MKRFYAALFLLAVTLAACFWGVAAVDDLVERMQPFVAVSDFEAAFALWQQNEGMLGALLPHNELDEVECLLVRLMADRQGEIADAERLRDVQTLQNRLDHLTRLQRPSVHNVL